MSTISRRTFVSSTAALLAGAPLVHASGQEQTISVGLIGCGGRGTGAAENCLESSPNVRGVPENSFGKLLCGTVSWEEH